LTAIIAGANLLKVFKKKTIIILILIYSGSPMLSIINQLTSQYEKGHGFRANLIFINSAHLELLKKQLSEPDIEILAQLIGMDIVLVEANSKPRVSWMQIPWKHSKTA